MAAQQAAQAEAEAVAKRARDEQLNQRQTQGPATNQPTDEKSEHRRMLAEARAKALEKKKQTKQ